MTWNPPSTLDALAGLVRDDHVLEDAAAHAREWLYQDDLRPAYYSPVLAQRIARDLCVLLLRLYAAANPAPEPQTTIEERLARFEKLAVKGAIFVNEYGRRSVIIGVDPERAYDPPRNGYKPPHYGPWYRVRVLWEDAPPSPDVMPWYTIGWPEAATQ